MEKIVELWSVKRLREQFAQITFPEYQREPNLWSLVEKQRLIDSMVRRFDIASLYLYEHNDGSVDCVDGRQRIGSIMSFLGHNTDDQDDRFPLKALNEIHQEDEPRFQSLEGMTYEEICKQCNSDSAGNEAREFVERLLDYQLTIVKLSHSQEPSEFNLQFTRLNLGTIIISGEKLNAMVGEVRDECFGDGGLGSHPFLEATRIPTRRFAKEQVAAQILAQIFSYEDTGDFARTRHFDLQRLFKQHGQLEQDQKTLIKRVRILLDLLHDAFHREITLRNRAVTVSAVLLGWTSALKTQEEASAMAAFMREFQNRLNWQVKKGLNADTEYHYLIDFQKHLTQASVEKPAVVARHRTLNTEYRRWLDSQELRGDAEWKVRNPDRDLKEESLSAK